MDKKIIVSVSIIFLMILILIPHFKMVSELEPLEKEFKNIAKNDGSGIYFTGEYYDRGQINELELDYGGTLDTIIAKRTAILMSRQYIPFFTGKWWITDGYFPSTSMFYIYTYLPPSLYDRIVHFILIRFCKVSEKNFEKYNNDVNIFRKKTIKNIILEKPPEGWY